MGEATRAANVQLVRAARIAERAVIGAGADHPAEVATADLVATADALRELVGAVELVGASLEARATSAADTRERTARRLLVAVVGELRLAHTATTVLHLRYGRITGLLRDVQDRS